MKKSVLFIVALLLLISCKEDSELVVDQPVTEVVTLNVDVVLPAGIQQQWQNAIDWAMENIAKAQQKQPRQVRLNLRYHDEDTEALDELAYNLTHPEAGDDTCHAIIGPYHSDNAQTFLSHAAATNLPVVMPTCTSADLQRIHARSTYAWFLTESDITQCEIMIAAARVTGDTDVALIYSNDTYGRSFADWFGYYAAEQDMHVAGGMISYEKGDDLSSFMQAVAASAKGGRVRVLVALSDAADYKPVCDQVVQVNDFNRQFFVKSFCADTSYDLQVLSFSNFSSFYMGITPSASRRFGFSQAYSGRYLQPPLNGEAQIYDAITLIALGAAHRLASPDSCFVDDKLVSKPSLSDYMRSVVANSQCITTQWNAAGLASAFSELAARRPVDITGASGLLLFDQDTHTKLLNTTYMVWKINIGSLEGDIDPYLRVQPVIYLSTQGASGEASTTAIWQYEKRLEQAFDDFSKNNALPPVTDHWALVISPSTTWENYRHQADAFAMYQLLREHGYDDDHIILIVEDNLANDAHNKYPGKIYIESPSSANDGAPSGTTGATDVRKNAVVDYHFSDLQADDLADIFMGRQSARLPYVMHPDSTSNIFIFWSGHGGPSEGPFWGNENAHEYFGTERIKNIVSQMNDADMYRRMMFAIETCYSGQWGEALIGQPDVLVLTAANDYETSKADVFDQQLGVYLSNAFARTFRIEVGTSPDITLYDLYRHLYKTTNGSHVTIYNHEQYGSVYTETMQDYFQ